MPFSDVSMEETDDAFSDSDDDIQFDDHDHFDPVVPDKEVRKVYQVPFKCYSPADIIAFQNNEIQHVNGIVGGSPETSGISYSI
jgi:ariadne-1